MIQILWATARPKMFVERHKTWMEKASENNYIHTLVAVNTQAEKDEIEELYEQMHFRSIDCDIQIKVTGDNLGVVKPIYELTKDLSLVKDSNIVIVVCDDVDCIQDWDEYLTNELKDFDGALMIRDGYQHYEYDYNKVIKKQQIPQVVSMPVMTFGCLKKLNKIIFHPDYLHYFADNELFLNLLEMGLLKDERSADSVVFEHIHYCTGKRASDNLDNEIIGLGNGDRATWYKRWKLPVEKRILLNSFND